VKKEKIDCLPNVSFPGGERALPFVCARHAAINDYHEDVIKEFKKKS
jgi:hypothetical protein